VDRLGRTLAKAVTAYNQTVGSLESRVLPSARRLSELGVVDGELAGPALVEEVPRTLSAPELVAGPGPEVADVADASLDAASLVRTAR
jgi:DNA recombination protein RmuC